MSNPFIPLAKTALKQDMSKNELRLLLVLIMQTIGYHKATDNLTDKRLAQLTNIRLDHLRPCLERFLDYGLFERIEHQHYDYQYRLCAEFLDDSSNHIYPPTLPDNRETHSPCSVSLPHHGAENAPRSVGFPSDGGHTTENPNIKKTQQHKTEKNDFQKKPQQKTITAETEKTITQTQPQPSITISMAGLVSLPEHFVIESSQPIRLEFSAKNVGQAVAVATDRQAETTSQAIATPIAEIAEPGAEPIAKIAKPIAKPQAKPASKSIIKSPLNNNSKPLADLAVSVANSLIKPSENTPSTTTKTPFVVVNKKEKKQSQPPKSKPVIKLPKAVGEENMNACNRYFQPLNEQQQKDVIAVFFHNLKTSTINNKAGYFIGLCKKVVTPHGLTVPHEALVKKQPSPKQLASDKKADQAREKHASLWADYQWIKRQAATLNQSETAMAEMMGLQEAYVLFSQREACAA